MSELASIVLPFLGLLAVFIALRKVADVEIKPIEVTIAAAGIGLWLIGSGKIDSLSWGDLTIKAFQKAAAKPASTDARPLEPLEVRPVEAAAKAATSDIPALLSRRTEALTFRLGAGAYDGGAIQEYLDDLTAAPFLKWIVIEEPAGALWGLSDARALVAATHGDRTLSRQLAMHLNSGESADRDWLEDALPGFVPAGDALPADASRQDALARFERGEMEALPALDANGRLRGMVRRDTLVTGLLADVTARLDGSK